ncbi:MAG: class I SAM-dependent methyltransferase [Asgard group archaeon]|nr:class I SAM-dependent methyltransferase [Asgard group archaeon]
MLDIACGKGKWGFLSRLNAPFLVKEPPRKIVGCDLFRPYLHFCQGLSNVYDYLVRCDARYLPFKEGSFDTVLVAEVLEHLNKADGEKIFAESERCAKKKIIISTPQYPFHQEALDKNVHQEHISRYTAKDLKKRGFVIYGVGLHFWRYVFPITIPKLPSRFAYLLIACKNKK